MPIPDELPQTDEAGNPSGLRWTWRRGLWAFLLIPVLTVCLMLFDPPLQPLDDPQAGATREIAAKDNGWVFLSEKWNYRNLPNVPRPEENHLYAFLKAKTAWDENDPVLAQAAQRGRDRLRELREALAYPSFQTPSFQTPLLTSFRGDGFISRYRVRDDVWLTLLQLLHRRQTAGALDTLLLLDQAARRMFAESITLEQFSSASAFADLAVKTIPGFLATVSPDSALVSQLERICEIPWFTRETFPRSLHGDVVACRNYLVLTPHRELANHGYLSHYPLTWWMWKFAFKPRQSANDLAAGLREAKAGWLGTHISSGGRFQKHVINLGGRRDLRFYLNAPGSYFSSNVLNTWASADYGARLCLFDQQAMRVCIALHRWEAAGGSVPETLKEVIPAYLPEVPLDPFHGKPMQWDPHSGGVIYSEVGPAFSTGPSFGIVRFTERPELRLKP